MSPSFHDNTSLDIIKRLSNSICNISGLHLSAFDKSGKTLFTSGTIDPVSYHIHSVEGGLKEFEHFFRHAIRSTFSRDEVTVLKDPTKQYHFFLPISMNETKLVISLGAFYASMKDFNEFLKNNRERYNLSNEVIDKWNIKDIRVKDFESIVSISENISSVFNEFITSKYHCIEFETQYNLVKTILGILTDLKPQMNLSEIYRIISDFPLLLLDLHTVSYSSYNEDINTFITKISAGIYSEIVKDKNFPVSGIIEEALNSRETKITNDIYEIHRLGLGEEINSVCIFPVNYNDKTIGIFNIYDSDISQNQIDILHLFIKVMGYMIGTIQLKEDYKKNIDRISSLQTVTSILDPTSEQDQLFNSIVDSASDIAKANRASLMLLDGDEFLHLKAVKGINSHVAKGIRVKVGEPVAGKVIATKSPLMIRDISKEYIPFTKFGSTYKTRSFISIPLIIKERAIGVLSVADKLTGRVFSEEDFQLLKSYASHASVIIESSNYYNLSEQMRELSITDSLTEVFNRRYFNDRLTEEIQRSMRHNFEFALAITDIDNFKAFNDAEGHLVGDSVLKAISNITKESLRATDILARFGGEEFAIILPQTDKNGAFQIAERIRDNIRNYCPKFWKTYPEDYITISIGISMFPENGPVARDLVKCADKALYIAKMQGKDRTIIYQ